MDVRGGSLIKIECMPLVLSHSLHSLLNDINDGELNINGLSLLKEQLGERKGGRGWQGKETGT